MKATSVARRRMRERARREAPDRLAQSTYPIVLPGSLPNGRIYIFGDGWVKP